MKAGETIVKVGKEFYRGKCYVCHDKVKEKGFTIHHLFYIPNDVLHKNYKNRDKYYEDLEQMIRMNPKRFLLVCSKHHQSIERLKRFSEKNFKRLVSAVKMSR